MQNFGQNPQKNLSRTSILTELSNGNVELGEAFALILSDMVVQSGITNPESEPFDVVPDSWRKLAAKPEKTPDDIIKMTCEAVECAVSKGAKIIGVNAEDASRSNLDYLRVKL